MQVLVVKVRIQHIGTVKNEEISYTYNRVRYFYFRIKMKRFFNRGKAIVATSEENILEHQKAWRYSR